MAGAVLGALVATAAAVPGETARQPAPVPSAEIVGRGVISTEAPEFATSLTPDGGELYFNRASADRATLRIMVARRTADGGWSEPVVAGFSGTHRDVDPFVAPDGRRLYFSSDRPRRPGAPAGPLATWYVERTAQGWGPPIDPGPPLNSDAGDVFVSAARDGLLLFASSRDGAARVFAATPSASGWAAPRAVAFGSVSDAGNPAIAPSGRFAVIVRTAAGGSPDLFVSCRTGAGAWAEPRALDAANSPFADFAPYVDSGERFLYFTSERPGIAAAVPAGRRPPGDLYRIPLTDAGVSCR